MSMKSLLVVIIGLLFLYGMFTVGFPFLLALVFALALEPLVLLFMRTTKLNRAFASTVVCTLFTLGVLGLVYLIGLKVYSEVVGFLRNLPQIIKHAEKIIQDTLNRTQGVFDQLPDDLVRQLQSGAQAGMSALIDALSSLSKSAINLAAVIPNLFIVFIVFIVALYLTSYGLNSFKGSFLGLFEETSREKVSEVLQNLHKSIFGFVRAQIIISGLTYLVALTGLLILRVDYALALALLIIIVDILPILGTGSVLVPWAVFSFITGNAFLGIGLIILFLVITVFRRMIEPKIIGTSIGIGALSTLISLWVGFELVGVIGIFLGPIIVIIYQAMRRVGLLDIRIRLE